MFHTTFFSFLYMLKKKFRKRFCTCVMGKKQQKKCRFLYFYFTCNFFFTVLYYFRNKYLNSISGGKSENCFL